MAEALFRAHLQQLRPEDWQCWRVESAGTWANDGESISANSQQVLVRRGLDLKNHRSQTIRADLLESFDLILTMEAGHKEAIRVEFPNIANRVFLMSEMINTCISVKDPYGGPVEAYEQTAKTLENMITKGFVRILQLVLSRYA